MGLVRASRITYVGELGWELYVPTEFASHIYETIIAAGDPFGLKPAGLHALNSLRIEKAYRHWGHDISEEETPVEAGLMFAVKLSKPDFIGRDAILRQKEEGVKSMLVQFALEDPEPLLYHNEPIYRDGSIVGYLTSGMYGHALGTAIGLGYVKNKNGIDADYINAGRYELEVAGNRFAARASIKPMFDPENAKIKV
jgi:glycine cleavage system aminomethyltransferase T